MKRQIATATLNKRLPAGFTLPREFSDFVTTAAATDSNRHGWFDIKWSDPFAFGLKREVRAELVPFLRLGDGGFVAFWLRKANTPAAIVHLDSEGGSAVVAEDFDGFLARLAARKTGIPDIDDAEEKFPFFSAHLGKKNAAPKIAVISRTLRADFAKWINSATDTHAPQPADATDLEKLRKQIHQAATAMLRDKTSVPITQHAPVGGHWIYMPPASSPASSVSHTWTKANSYRFPPCMPPQPHRCSRRSLRM